MHCIRAARGHARGSAAAGLVGSGVAAVWRVAWLGGSAPPIRHRRSMRPLWRRHAAERLTRSQRHPLFRGRIASGERRRRGAGRRAARAACGAPFVAFLRKSEVMRVLWPSAFARGRYGTRSPPGGLRVCGFGGFVSANLTRLRGTFPFRYIEKNVCMSGEPTAETNPPNPQTRNRFTAHPIYRIGNVPRRRVR